MTKRNVLLFLVLTVIIGIVAVAAESLIRGRAERKRQVSYQDVLRGYTAKFNPGIERREVESTLANQGRSFQQMCCLINENRNALEDIVKIGSEPKPWYCSENGEYLVFEFDSPVESEYAKAQPSDRLRAIKLSQWLGGCL
jgi:hypothetical protein